jgi:hypothetical protein
MCGVSYTSAPQYAFMAWCSVKKVMPAIDTGALALNETRRVNAEKRVMCVWGKETGAILVRTYTYHATERFIVPSPFLFTSNEIGLSLFLNM